MPDIPAVVLNDGTALPQLGFGTYGLRGDPGVAAIVSAIETGYRLIDTAVRYENEREVGEAVRQSGVDRDEIVVATKVPGADHGYDATMRSAHESLDRLGLDRIELYLIHWPNPRVDRYVDTWRAMMQLRAEGLVRTIGVSNFTPGMLMRLSDETGATPAVNQVELHPYFPQAELREYHLTHGIRTESWSPLAVRGELLGEPVIRDIAAARGMTPAQVVLRWHIELHSTPIPKSASAERQRENADVFDLPLDAGEVAAISGLERGRLWGADPLTHEEM